MKMLDKWMMSNSLRTEEMFLVGLEKESMRTEKEVHIASTPHPAALGSALTHPYITTDFAEPLLEIVTPPYANIRALLDFMAQLHHHINRHIDEETLWPASMPPVIKRMEDIKIAEYGSSHTGRVRNIYRRGLALRYGKPMQTIAGIHLNFSLSAAFLEQYRQFAAQKVSASSVYFHIMRNYIRFSWLVNYLFGASPLLDKSFLNKQSPPPFLEELDASTYIQSASTCLRMSRLGYTNLTQDSFQLCFNQLDEYVRTMINMLTTKNAVYAQAGIKINGEYRQLNANQLQVENEYYAAIRPKAIRTSQEKTIDVLAERGVEYLEVRNLDLNPFKPLGLDEEELLFMQLLLCYCALVPSPFVDTEECHSILVLDEKILMNNIRTEKVYTSADGNSWTLPGRAREILAAMEPLAATLEEASRDGKLGYMKALKKQQEKLSDQELLPSRQLIAFVKETKQNFVHSVARLAKEYKKSYQEIAPSMKQEAEFNKMKEESLSKERQLRGKSTGDFDAFVEDYLSTKQLNGR